MSSVLRDQNEDFVKNSSVVSHYSKLYRLLKWEIASLQGKQLLIMGYKISMCDISAFAWKDSLSKEHLVNNVISIGVPENSVMFHDSGKSIENNDLCLN